MLKQMGAVVVMAGVFVASQAQAALPAEATAAFTAIGTSITDVVAAVWVPLGIVVAAFVAFKLFRRGTSKI